MSAFQSSVDERRTLSFLISDAIRPSFSDEVNAALGSVSAQQSVWDEGEDPDDWIEITQRDLEQSLNVYVNTRSHNRDPETQDTSMEIDKEVAEEDKTANEQAARLKRLAERVDAFVEGEGDISGAMFEEYVHSLVPSTLLILLIANFPTALMSRRATGTVRVGVKRRPRRDRLQWMHWSHHWSLENTARCLQSITTTTHNELLRQLWNRTYAFQPVRHP